MPRSVLTLSFVLAASMIACEIRSSIEPRSLRTLRPVVGPVAETGSTAWKPECPAGRLFGT